MFASFDVSGPLSVDERFTMPYHIGIHNKGTATLHWMWALHLHLEIHLFIRTEEGEQRDDSWSSEIHHIKGAPTTSD